MSLLGLWLFVGMTSEVFTRVLIASKDIEVISIDLDVSANAQITRSNELHVVIDVLILLSAEEGTLNDTGVLLGGLEDRDSVISKVERDDEPPVNIFGNLGVEASSVSQDLLIVVDVLEEINLGLLRHKVIHITKRVDLVTKAVMRRNLHNDGASVRGLLDISERELASVLAEVVILSGLVDTANSENSAISCKGLTEANLVAREVSITDESLTRLVDVKRFGKFLSSEVDGEGISSIVREMHLSDLNSVISQEVVPDELQVITSREESENLAVEVEELLLRGNSTSTKLLLKVLEQLRVLLRRHGLQGLGEVVFGAGLSISLRSSTIKEERSGILVSVVDSDGAAADANVETDIEVSGLKGHLRTILLEHHLSLEESTLR